jgi:hypothetical protein
MSNQIVFFWVPIFKVKINYLVLEFRDKRKRVLIRLFMVGNSKEDILMQINNFCVSNKILNLKFVDEITETKVRNTI